MTSTAAVKASKVTIAIERHPLTQTPYVTKRLDGKLVAFGGPLVESEVMLAQKNPEKWFDSTKQEIEWFERSLKIYSRHIQAPAVAFNPGTVKDERIAAQFAKSTGKSVTTSFSNIRKARLIEITKEEMKAHKLSAQVFPSKRSLAKAFCAARKEPFTSVTAYLRRVAPELFKKYNLAKPKKSARVLVSK